MGKERGRGGATRLASQLHYDDVNDKPAKK